MLRRFLSTRSLARREQHVQSHLLLQQKRTSRLALLSSLDQHDHKPTTSVFLVAKDGLEPTDLQARLPFKVSLHALRDFQAKAQEKKLLYPTEDDASLAQHRVVLVGLGPTAKVTEDTLRAATSSAMKLLQNKRIDSAIVHLPELQEAGLKPARVVQVLSQASMLSNYMFDQYLSSTPHDDANHEDNGATNSKTRPVAPLESVYLDVSEDFNQVLDEQAALAQETIFARNLGNERSHVVNPAFMETVTRASAAELPNTMVHVLQDQQLRQEGMNMFASVGQAATCPPRLVILEYRGNPASDDCIALIGKGVTFDTGGLNLKPTGSMEDMHVDMCGSAAVLGATRAIARMELKVNIVCALGLAENAIGSKAVKPRTIVKSHKGITVEINNTDAEGRLVLGDTMSYVQKNYKPKTVVDVATLTGACMIALGECCAGLFSNSDQLASKLKESGRECHERCWHLPILPEHTAELKGFEADSRSTGTSRLGGASVAAAFLQQFVEKEVEWAHLDIAGPAHYTRNKSLFPKGATGFGVQLLYTFVKNHGLAHK